MSERCIFDEYPLRGADFEVWSDGSEGWWLATHDWVVADCLGVDVNTVLVDTDFTPRLTERELNRIADAVFDWYVRD